MDTMPIWVVVLVSVLFVLLPLVVVFSGVKTFTKVHRFRKGAKLVKGKVVDVKETTSQGGEDQTPTTSYQPVFEFGGGQGGVLRGETFMSSAGYNFARGSEHDILVNFEDSGTVHMPGNGPYIFGLVMVIIGGVVALGGVLLVRSML